MKNEWNKKLRLPWKLKWKEKKTNGSKEIFYSVRVKKSCASA